MVTVVGSAGVVVTAAELSNFFVGLLNCMCVRMLAAHMSWLADCSLDIKHVFSVACVINLLLRGYRSLTQVCTQPLGRQFISQPKFKFKVF